MNQGQDCPFCKIARHELPADVVFEDTTVLAFKPLEPMAAVHVLIVPRKHYGDINGLKTSDEAVFGKIVRVASELAAQSGLDKKGWQLFVRVGKGGGQEVPHVHFHLVSGQQV